jgi:signal transduction histidine kinase
MLSAGLNALHLLSEMHVDEERARRVFAQRTQRLSSIYGSIQSYSETIQQYVLSPPSDADRTRDELRRLSAQVLYEFGRCAGQPSEVQPTLKAMEDLFARQQQLFDSLLELPRDERSRRAPEFFTSEVLPFRLQIRRWSDTLSTWNVQQIQNTDHAMVMQFRDLQTSLTESLLLSLGSGLVLVLASMVYILRLERQTRLRYEELVRSRGELERLSASLVEAQESERRSLSRELHDEVGQSLGALLVDLGRLSSAMVSNRPELKEQVDKMREVAERTIQAVRNMSLLLRPSMLDDLGLVAALEWHGREVSRHSEIEVEVDSKDVSEDLPDEYNVCIYRLVQEALNNAVRHSGARSVRVRVEQSADRISAIVSDTGRGFVPKRSRGLGILGMEERIKRLGGSLVIDSTPGQGTTLTAELPLPARVLTPA